MRMNKTFCLSIENVMWLESNKHLNHSQIMDRLLTRHISELNLSDDATLIKYRIKAEEVLK